MTVLVVAIACNLVAKKYAHFIYHSNCYITAKDNICLWELCTKFEYCAWKQTLIRNSWLQWKPIERMYIWKEKIFANLCGSLKWNLKWMLCMCVVECNRMQFSKSIFFDWTNWHYCFVLLLDYRVYVQTANQTFTFRSNWNSSIKMHECTGTIQSNKFKLLRHLHRAHTLTETCSRRPTKYLNMYVHVQ